MNVGASSLAATVVHQPNSHLLDLAARERPMLGWSAVRGNAKEKADE
jgi:hypothetical protein